MQSDNVTTSFLGSLLSRSSKQHFRLTVIPAAILVTIVLVVLVGALVAPEDSGQLGGDFPAFYGAGSVVADRGYDQLYDPAVQQAAQQGLIENEGGYLFFAYPPFVATGYSWLTPLGYRGAYIAQMLLMGAAAVATVLLLRPMSETVRRFPLATLALLVLYQPLMASLIGGQNTALTMLLFVAAARAEWSGADVLAGVAVGLLAYKPQYGAPLAFLVAASGKWRVLAGIAATWIGLYVAGALALGVGWVGPWWEQATAFRDINAGVNGHLFVSLPGYVEHLSGVGGTTGRVIGLVIGTGGVLALTWLWRRADTTVMQRYALAATGLVLVAPQSLFYEAGVAAVTLLLLVDADARIRAIAAATWVAGWLYAATSGIVNTTVLVVAVTAVLAVAVANTLKIAVRNPQEIAA